MDNNFDNIKKIYEDGYFDLFARYDVCFTHGIGSTLYDTQGRAYTDFLAGIAVNCLGYGDPDVTEAISQQAKKLMHSSNLFYNLPQTELTALLTADGVFDRVFLCNSGAEANEAAIKLVRKFFNARGGNERGGNERGERGGNERGERGGNERGGKKYKIVTAINSFHGRTLATAAATGQPKYSAPFAPLPEGFIHLPFNDCAALEECFKKDNQIAALMLETIQGEGGVIPATEEYMQLARRLTEDSGALFILDEIQTGVMRCGRMYSADMYGITPDVLTLAKGLGGGMPIGAVLARGEAANALTRGEHGTTFGGNPVCCAAACAVLKKINTEEFAIKVQEKGILMRRLLSELLNSSVANSVSGMGLLSGLKLSEGTDGRDIVNKMLQKGFIINCAGNNTLRFAPPLIITHEEIAAMVAALSGVLGEFSN